VLPAAAQPRSGGAEHGGGRSSVVGQRGALPDALTTGRWGVHSGRCVGAQQQTSVPMRTPGPDAGCPPWTLACPEWTLRWTLCPSGWTPLGGCGAVPDAAGVHLCPAGRGGCGRPGHCGRTCGQQSGHPRVMGTRGPPRGLAAVGKARTAEWGNHSARSTPPGAECSMLVGVGRERSRADRVTMRTLGPDAGVHCGTVWPMRTLARPVVDTARILRVSIAFAWPWRLDGSDTAARAVRPATRTPAPAVDPAAQVRLDRAWMAVDGSQAAA
jgi:hypothetical protein